MPDVEFLSSGHDGGSGEDVLGAGPRRPLPRWAIVLLAVLAAAGVGTLIVAHVAGPKSAAAKTSAAPYSSRPYPPPLADRPGDVGTALELGSKQPVLDVAVNLDSVWILQPDRLTGNGLIGRNRHVRLDLHVPDGAAAQLVLDVPAARLWVVLEGATRGDILEYDAFTLRPLRVLSWPTGFNGAAGLRGQLYLTSGSRILTPGRTGLRAIATLPTTLGSLVGDNARDRLIVLDYGFPAHAWQCVPATRTCQQGPFLPVGKASIALVRDAVWVGGYNNSSAKLVRLEPRTLRPVAVSPLSSQVGPGARVVASGNRVFWVRGGGGGDALWCVAADTGRSEQTWHVEGAVASTRHGALVGSGLGAYPLVLSGCTG